MWRVAFLLVLLPAPVAAADLPPGALVRFGDDRFRAGGCVYHLALSPDGKQFATTRPGRDVTFVVAVWDSATGRPLHTYEANAELFKGFTWGSGGAHAVVVRADAKQRFDQKAELVPDDFRVWDFTDPRTDPQPVLASLPSFHGGGGVIASQPKGSPKYTDFVFSTDGRRAAARWKSADGKHAVHVFDLKPTATATKLTRAGLIDLGAEGADDVRLSADGQTLVVFRKLVKADELVATAWDVATSKPARPVRAPASEQLILTPDASALVVFVREADEWGFDHFELATGKRRPLTRWRYTAEQIDAGGPSGTAGSAFGPSGRELAVAVDKKTYVIDVVRGKELGRLEGHADAPGTIAFSADGSTIATADRFGLVRLWDTNTLRPFEPTTGHRAPIQHAELSPDGKRLLTWAEDETVRLWDLATGKELRAFAGAIGAPSDHPRFEAPATFTPDGTAILYSTTKRLIARDLLTGTEAPLPGDMAKLDAVRFAVFAPDGSAVLTWNLEPNFGYRFEVWDWPSGKKRFALTDVMTMKSPGFSPDGSGVYLDATAPARWDAKTGKELPLPEAWKGVERVHPLLALRPNPRWLFHEDDRGLARVIEAGTAKPLTRFRFEQVGEETWLNAYWGLAVSPTGGQYAWSWQIGNEEIELSESATCTVRRTLRGHRGEARVLGFTPDGTKLLTASGDHTVLVWDMRLLSVPLPEALKKETSAAKLWEILATGKADAAYLAMARLAREPEAVVKLAKMKLKPVAKAGKETDANTVADARAIELLEALDTEDSRALLKELASGHAEAFRTQEAKRALERNRAVTR